MSFTNLITDIGTVSNSEIESNAVQTAQLNADAVTNAKLANMNANTVKVNATTSAANPTDLAVAASRVVGRASTGNIDDLQVDESMMNISNAGTNGQFLQKQSGNTGGLTWADASGSGGGFAAPTGGDLITSATTNTTFGTGFQAIALEADTDAASTFYIAGGVEYRSFGNSTVRALRMLNPTGIANGLLQLYAGGLPAVSSQASPAFATTLIWDNDNNGFVGYPLQSTFHGNASNTYMAWGANGSSFGTPTQYSLSTVLTGTTSNINIGLYHGGTISGTITVESGQTVTLGLQTANTNGNRTRLYANKLS